MAASPAAPWPRRTIRRNGAPRAFDLTSPGEYWHTATTAGPGRTRLPMTVGAAGAVDRAIAAGQVAAVTRVESLLAALQPAAARHPATRAASAPVTCRPMSLASQRRQCARSAADLDAVLHLRRPS